MMFLGWAIATTGAILGHVATRAYYTAKVELMKASHEHQMNAIYEEVTRCRAQVALHIGKDK